MSNINKLKKITVKASKNYSTRAQKQEDEKKRKLIDKSPSLLVLYICGILGMLLCAGEALSLDFPILIFITGVASLLTGALWYLYFYQSRLFIISSAILISVCCVILIPQVYGSSRYIMYMAGNNMSLWLLFNSPGIAVPMSILVIYLLFSLEFILRNHSIMFLLGLAILILVPLSGYDIKIPSLLLLIIFEIGFFVLNMTEKRRLRDGLVMKKKSRAGMLSAIITAAILLTVFAPSYLIEQLNQENIFRTVYHADGFLKDAYARLVGSSVEDVSGGKLNRGNLHRTGQQMLEVSIDRLPSDRIYLHSYHGKDYTDSEWTSAFERFYYKNSYNDEYLNNTYDEIYDEHQNEAYTENVYQEPFMYEFLNDFRKENISGAYMLSSSFPSISSFEKTYLALTSYTSDPISEMYFMLAENSRIDSVGHIIEGNDIYSGNKYFLFQATNSDTFKNTDAVDFKVKHIGDDYINALFIPYYSSKSVGRIWETNDITREDGYSVPFLTAEQISMTYRWENSELTQKYERFTEAYIQKTREEYLGYPAETLSRLKSYCDETPLTELNDITTYILVTLQNKAQYSTTPGTTPFNKDVVDYFLFENGSGYCVHFASAAALMYRMYGIPARYVTGFVVEPKLFVSDANGNFTAKITDEYAHAWVEIFLKDYGWVPVEVTPTETGQMNASYPGYNTVDMMNIMEKYGWTFRSSGSSDNNGNGFGGNFSFNSFFGIISVSIPLAAILIFIVYIIIKNIVFRKKLSSVSCRRLFDLTIKALHFSGLLKSMNGSERDFADRLKENINLSEDDVERFMLTIQAANYSDMKVSKADRDHMEKCYRQISSELYFRLSFFKKVIFRYILFPGTM